MTRDICNKFWNMTDWHVLNNLKLLWCCFEEILKVTSINFELIETEQWVINKVAVQFGVFYGWQCSITHKVSHMAVEYHVWLGISVAQFHVMYGIRMVCGGCGDAGWVWWFGPEVAGGGQVMGMLRGSQQDEWGHATWHVSPNIHFTSDKKARIF